MNPLVTTLALTILSLQISSGQTPTPTQTPTATPPPTATYSLAYAPKEGDTLLYQLTGSIDLQGIDAKMDSKVEEKVIKVNDDGSYRLQSKTLEGTVTFSGQQMQVPKNTSVATYKPSGEAVYIEGDQVDPSTVRAQNLVLLKRPEHLVKIGDTWTIDIKADPVAKTPSLQGTFTFDGEDMVGKLSAYKVESRVSEGEVTSPGSILASYWVSKDDGSLLKYDCKYTSVVFPGSPSPLSGILTMIRIVK